MPPLARCSIICSLLLVVSCVPPPPEDPRTALVPEVDDKSLIIGTVDWQEVTMLPAGSPERINSHSVGYLSIPARGTRCTAFLVAPDVIMTNNHCVGRASDAAGVTISLRRELGVAFSSWATFDCSGFIGTDSALDFTLLRCQGDPGTVHGVVALDEGTVSSGDAAYVIHQNCDYYTNPFCMPNKKYSPGGIRSVWNTSLRHDADTLGGSSGAPLFSSTNHQVVGLHNAGFGNDGNGRGRENNAVPMRRIVPEIRSRFPSVQLGPAGTTAPPQPIGDAFEPNDSTADATDASSGLSATGLEIHDANDRDVFRVDRPSGGSITALVQFSHQAGDLDAQLRSGSVTGPAVAYGTSISDDESLSANNLPPGTYYLVVYGYAGATNSYDLDVF